MACRQAGRRPRTSKGVRTSSTAPAAKSPTSNPRTRRRRSLGGRQRWQPSWALRGLALRRPGRRRRRGGERWARRRLPARYPLGGPWPLTPRATPTTTTSARARTLTIAPAAAVRLRPPRRPRRRALMDAAARRHPPRRRPPRRHPPTASHLAGSRRPTAAGTSIIGTPRRAKLCGTSPARPERPRPRLRRRHLLRPRPELRRSRCSCPPPRLLRQRHLRRRHRRVASPQRWGACESVVAPRLPEPPIAAALMRAARQRLARGQCSELPPARVVLPPRGRHHLPPGRRRPPTADLRRHLPTAARRLPRWGGRRPATAALP